MTGSGGHIGELLGEEKEPHSPQVTAQEVGPTSRQSNPESEGAGTCGEVTWVLPLNWEIRSELGGQPGAGPGRRETWTETGGRVGKGSHMSEEEGLQPRAGVQRKRVTWS